LKIALWKYESAHKKLPESVDAADELVEIANGLIRAAEVNENVLKKVSQEQMRRVLLWELHVNEPKLYEVSLRRWRTMSSRQYVL
jgi:hypothetical protein